MNLPAGYTQHDLDAILGVLDEFEGDAEKDGNPEARDAIRRAQELLTLAYTGQ